MFDNNVLAGNVGLYLRLSREDGDKIESDSIQSQRDLVRGFLSNNNRVKIFDEYIDDGYSGTNFDRPGFKRMIDDARLGKIKVIIVKDLSRLGRNYIETGRYIEKLFPSMGIRLIAINDNYDSADKAKEESQIIVPFKNLINDAYCRDISIKTRTSFDVKRKKGQFIGAFAPYGYQKDEHDGNKLVIDEYASRIVEMIFDMKITGYSIYTIRDKLNEMGVQPPYEYKRKSGMKFDSGFRSLDNGKWHHQMVKRILENRIYIGVMVQGKRKKINYKVKKIVDVEEQEWICVEGTHEPIVKKDTFDTVQKLLSQDTRRELEEEKVSPLAGYVKCGDCSQNMVRHSTKYLGKTYRYYHCSTFKMGGDCSPHNVEYVTIENAVISAVRREIALFDKAEPILKNAGLATGESIAVKTLDGQMAKLKEEIEHYGIVLAKLYQDMVDEVVTKQEYRELHDRFNSGRLESEQAYRNLEEKKKEVISGNLKFQPWINDLMKYRDITSLSRAMVVSLLSSVIVYSATHIEVRFLFEDEISAYFDASGLFNNDEQKREVAS